MGREPVMRGSWLPSWDRLRQSVRLPARDRLRRWAWPPAGVWVRRPGLWLAVAIAVVVLVGWTYRQAARARDLADPVRARREGRPVPVRTAPVSEGEAEFVVGGTAVTVPSDTVILHPGPDRSKQSDPVAELTVAAVRSWDGEAVRRGQVVIALAGELPAQIARQREAALAAAEAELERVRHAVERERKLRQVDLDSARAEVEFRAEEYASRKAAHERVTKLSGAGAVSDREYYDVQVQLAEATYRRGEADRRLQRVTETAAAGAAADRAELARATSLADAARADLDAARAGVERCQIRAPFDGYVGVVEVAAGQTVTPSTPLARVVRLDPLLVRMDYPVDRLGDVAVGQAAEVVLDGLPQETFPGTVARVAPQAVADLRVLPVFIELANPGGRIKAGMTGYARVRVVRKAAVVPSLAVVRQGGKAVAFVVEGGRARVRDVRVGPPTGPEMLEVRGGLATGDEVVVFHNFYSDPASLAASNCFLQDNDPVDTDWRTWTRRTERDQ